MGSRKENDLNLEAVIKLTSLALIQANKFWITNSCFLSPGKSWNSSF